MTLGWRTVSPFPSEVQLSPPGLGQSSSGPSAAGSAAAVAGDVQPECSGEPGSLTPDPEADLEERNQRGKHQRAMELGKN